MDQDFIELTLKAESEMKRLQYNSHTIRAYKRWWNRFQDYSDQHNISSYTDSAVEMYFQDTFGFSYLFPSYPIPREVSRCYRSLCVLAQVKETGEFCRRRYTKDHSIPECYQPAASIFLTEYCSALSNATKRQMRSHLDGFIDYLSKYGITDFKSITKNTILSYWDTRKTLSNDSRCYDSYFLHKFFDFLYENGYTIVDNSVFVPKIKGSNRGTIPSYYTTDEISTLLSCVDRNSPMGKRDYAILLIAIRYGPRVEDIRNLKLTDIDWDKSQISYIQNKTGKWVTFKLYDDVATALIDYFKNGRPNTECRNVFVRHNAPYDKFGKDNNLHGIISKYMKMAGFTDFHHRKHGLHSMRHSIAGNLLNEGTPIATVAEVLNHESSVTTMHYTKIACEQTRACALEVD